MLRRSLNNILYPLLPLTNNKAIKPSLADEAKIFKFEIETNDTIYVISYENFEVTITDRYGDEVYFYQGSNLSYTFKGACWSANKKGEP